MTLPRALVLSALGLPLLALAACGEGYEPVAYQGFPYANERTAGSGVAWVRMNLMPEKGPVVDIDPARAAVEPEPAAAETEPAEPYTEEAEEIFKEMQRK
ncbi:MAG: hypothetical protein EOM26_09250 [Alphaproteobacteria bacterium]|nr:hypothetical protein [Alphaproteobacteria bacterium]